MEVIEHGKHKSKTQQKYKITCKNCGCVFLCDYTDFTYQERRINGKAGVRCPDCNTTIDFIPSMYKEL